MKKYLLFAIFVVRILDSYSQSVAINTDGTTAHSSAILDIKSSSKGLLIPRMTSTERAAIAAPAQGLFVFDLTTNSFWYYNGTAWNNLAQQAGSSAAVWMLQGNSNTNPSTDFIGTTDDKSLVFKIRNQPSGLIDSALSNTFLGFKSGYSFATGKFNTALGVQSLFSNTSGQQNTAIGNWALISNTAGNDNTAVGNNALRSNNGNSNTAVGNWALLSNTTGARNTAVGDNALSRTTNGADNVSMGYWSLLNNTTGTDNVAIGSGALFSNTSGVNNTAVGFQALTNSDAPGNSAFGFWALQNNSSGMFNTGLGTGALNSNTEGSTNTAVGHGSLMSNTTGHSNVAIGKDALFNNTIESNLVAVGDSALYRNTFGIVNTAVGSKALFSNTSGYGNTAIGYKSLYSNIDGLENTAVGYYTLETNNGGFRNIAVGNLALANNVSGIGNIAIGYFPMHSNSTGNNNIAIGFSALDNCNGSGNIAIGYEATVRNNGTNAIVIGNSQLASANEIVLGNPSHVAFFAQGIYNATTASAPNMFINSIGQIMRVTSSARYKEDITDLEINTSNIYNLRPVSYTSKTDKSRHFGLIAEEVAETIPELAEYAKEKDVIKGSTSEKLIPDAVQYPMLSVLLLKEVQRHQQIITTQQKAIEDQEINTRNQQQQIDALKKENTELKTLLLKMQKQIDQIKK